MNEEVSRRTIPFSNTKVIDTYDTAGRVTKRTDGGKLCLTQTYETKTGRVDTRAIRGGGPTCNGSIHASLNLDYDLASNVTRRVQTLTGNTFAGTYNYTYDEANRLKTVAGPADPDEVLAHEVLDQRMLGIETARRAGQRITSGLEPGRERRGVHRLLPNSRPLDARLADLGRRLGVGTPDAGADEHVAKFEAQVQPGACSSPADLCGKRIPTMVLQGDLSFENRVSR